MSHLSIYDVQTTLALQRFLCRLKVLKSMGHKWTKIGWWLNGECPNFIQFPKRKMHKNARYKPVIDQSYHRLETLTIDNHGSPNGHALTNTCRPTSWYVNVRLDNIEEPTSCLVIFAGLHRTSRSLARHKLHPGATPRVIARPKIQPIWVCLQGGNPEYIT